MAKKINSTRVMAVATKPTKARARRKKTARVSRTNPLTVFLTQVAAAGIQYLDKVVR